MYSNTADHKNLQAQGTLTEYERHVREGHTELQKAIREANPELAKDFDRIDANATATV